MLDVTIEESGETVILHCIGRIVRGHETAILCPATRQRKPNIILDLSEVDAIDAAGVGALVSLQAAGIYVQLMNPSKPVREILQVTRLDTVFEIHNSPLITSAEGVVPRDHATGLAFPPVMAVAT